MDIVAQNLQLILHSQDVPPPALVKQAESYNFQSKTSIPLKPTQEAARIHICCVLAVEALMDRFDLPLPDTKKPPIPPSQYTKSLNQFRTQLISPSTPRKQSRASQTTTPSKTPTRTPRTARTPRSARKNNALNNSKLDVDSYDDDDDDDYNESPKAMRLALDNGEDEDNLEFVTPRKRAPTGMRAGSPSPRKSPRKLPTKKMAGPTDSSIDAIGVKMGLERSTINAVIHGYNQYSQLVKDSWGLVYGLFVVVSDRAEPQLGSEHERRLVRAMGQLVPDVYVDRQEWISWVEKIITGQVWLTKISQTAEPQPHLVGSPGGWGLGVEFQLIDI